MTYLHTHSSGLLITFAIKPKAKENVVTCTMLLFHILQNTAFTEVTYSYFSEICYHASFQDPN
jgi:hypothetical protein